MKFALISWNGPSVGALKKAKMSTAKAVVKQVWSVRVLAMFYRLSVRGLREWPLPHNLKEKPYENVLGKGENSGQQHFLHFLLCFKPFPRLKF